MNASKPKSGYIFVAIGIVALLGAGVFFLRDSTEEAPVSETVAETSITLSSTEITRIALQDRVLSIRISGSLQPVQRVQLNAKVSGTLAAIHIDVGDTVKTGDLLVEFDTKDLRATRDERRASLQALEAQQNVAQTTLKRTRQLHGQGYTAKATLDEAVSAALQLQAQIQGVKAQIATAEKALNDARVLAPFDAVVATRPIEQGQTLAVNTELLTLVDLSSMELVARVPTSRIAQVKTAQSAQLHVEGYEERNFEAEVIRISPVADGNARTVPVYLQVNNMDYMLRGGMFATGQLHIEKLENLVLLPLSAIRKDEKGEYVLKVVNNTLVRQAVKVGQTWQEDYRAEITDGLYQGDTVVSAVLPDLKVGMTVTISTANGSDDTDSPKLL